LRGRIHIIPCPLHLCKIKTNPINNNKEWYEKSKRKNKPDPKSEKGKKWYLTSFPEFFPLKNLLENKLNRSARNKRNERGKGFDQTK